MHLLFALILLAPIRRPQLPARRRIHHQDDNRHVEGGLLFSASTVTDVFGGGRHRQQELAGEEGHEEEEHGEEGVLLRGCGEEGGHDMEEVTRYFSVAVVGVNDVV